MMIYKRLTFIEYWGMRWLCVLSLVCFLFMLGNVKRILKPKVEEYKREFVQMCEIKIEQEVRNYGIENKEDTLYFNKEQKHD